MERRSERLALLQKLKPISYRETGVKRVFKKIRRKRNTAAPESNRQNLLKENGPEMYWDESDLEDSPQPCCSKSLADQTHLLAQQFSETPPLVEPTIEIIIRQDQRPLGFVDNHPRPFRKILAFLAIIFLVGICYVFWGRLDTSDTSRGTKKTQLSHRNDILQRYLQRQIGGFRQKVVGLQNFAGSLTNVYDHWDIEKQQYLQAHGIETESKYIMKEDFALKSAGATVVKSSKSYDTGAKVCILRLCWDYSRSPEVILERDNAPGNCWAMDGSEGYIIIKLSRVVCPTSVALDHISKTISHTEEISSAPQNFSVYGFKDDLEKEEGNFLGSFVYKADGSPMQTFTLEGAYLDEFKYLLLKITSNWNNPNYTCIYGFHVYND